MVAFDDFVDPTDCQWRSIGELYILLNLREDVICLLKQTTSDEKKPVVLLLTRLGCWVRFSDAIQ